MIDLANFPFLFNPLHIIGMETALKPSLKTKVQRNPVNLKT